MAVYYFSPSKGKMDVDEFKNKEFTDEEKHDIINAAVSSIYNQLRLNAKNICTYNDHLWGDDLLADTLMRFLKRDIEPKWKIFLEGRLERYITSGMSMALRSSTSPFYFQYRKPNSKFRELIVEDGGFDYTIEYGYGRGDAENMMIKENIEIVNEEIKKMHFYDRQLITDYFYGKMSLREMEQKYNINSQRVGRDLKKALTKLKFILKTKLEL